MASWATMHEVTEPIELTDQVLVARAASGDASAYDRLYRRHYARVANLAMRLTGDAREAEDAALFAFQKGYEALPRLRDGQGFLKYVYRVVVNHVRREVRRRGDRRSVSIEEALVEDRSSTGPVAMAESHALAAQMVESISRLSLEFREVIVLHHLQGLDLEHVSEVVGAPLGTVKSRLSRARARLRDAMRGWL